MRSFHFCTFTADASAQLSKQYASCRSLESGVSSVQVWATLCWWRWS